MSSSNVSRILPSFVLFAGSLLACSSSADAPLTTDTGVADTGTVKDSVASDSNEETPSTEPCMEPVEERPAGSSCVLTVRGKVIDTTGAPVKGKTVSVCGVICYYATTGSDGSYVATVNSHIVVTDFAASVHGRPDFASQYLKLPAGTVDKISLPDMVVPALPATGPKIPIDDSGKVTVISEDKAVTSADVTLTFTKGSTAELDLEDIADTVTGNQLRVAKVDEAHWPQAAKDIGVSALYAINPFDSKYDKKVGVKIANTGMADGDVEFVILGDEFVKAPVNAGVYRVVATGKVVGGTATTDAGEGINIVTWIGVRAKASK